MDCTEPGGIAHAARSETHWPLSVGAKVTYTCNPCYTGGGNITCQRNGQWTKKPTCRGEIICRKPHVQVQVYTGVELSEWTQKPICANYLSYKIPPEKVRSLRKLNLQK